MTHVYKCIYKTDTCICIMNVNIVSRTLKSFETFLRKGGRSTDYYIPPEVCVMMNTIIDCKNKVGGRVAGVQTTIYFRKCVS